ncbi:hypothetical protein E2C01_051302 [Portunus trituberculatus]|uniref:Uncharacterized protein n=1 Tax=Portunus trituberculatus TaxID=210409 RepID=A0A5B7GLF2_PORTR|nr:hypothetical protein [Portunus trituberculatus]
MRLSVSLARELTNNQLVANNNTENHQDQTQRTRRETCSSDGRSKATPLPPKTQADQECGAIRKRQERQQHRI